MAMELLADGFVLAEAPVVDSGGTIFVSDVVAGGVHRVDPDGTRTEVIPRRRGVGGMALHEDGTLVVTGRWVECGERDLLGPQPGVTVFNDLGVTDDGLIVVGALTFRPAAGEEPTAGALFRGTERIDTPQLRWPNGIGFAPDGATVYVADFADGQVHAGPSEAELEPWARVPRGSADGLAVDAEGGVWVALGPGAGVVRFAPDGAADALLDVDADFVSSVAFAGRDLVITTATSVLRTPIGIAGRTIPAVRG